MQQNIIYTQRFKKISEQIKEYQDVLNEKIEYIWTQQVPRNQMDSYVAVFPKLPLPFQMYFLGIVRLDQCLLLDKEWQHFEEKMADTDAAVFSDEWNEIAKRSFFQQASRHLNDPFLAFNHIKKYIEITQQISDIFLLYDVNRLNSSEQYTALHDVLIPRTIGAENDGLSADIDAASTLCLLRNGQPSADKKLDKLLDVICAKLYKGSLLQLLDVAQKEGDSDMQERVQAAVLLWNACNRLDTQELKSSFSQTMTTSIERMRKNVMKAWAPSEEELSRRAQWFDQLFGGYKKSLSSMCASNICWRNPSAAVVKKVKHHTGLSKKEPPKRENSRK